MKYMLLIHQGTRCKGGELVLLADRKPGSRSLMALALGDFRYLHSTRGEFLRRIGRTSEARESFGRALELVHNDAERRLLEQRPAELEMGASSSQH